MRKAGLPEIFSISCLMLVSLSLAGCANPVFAVPDAHFFTEPPRGVTLEKIYQDYNTNPATADSSFKTKRIMFTNITVEELVTIYQNPTYSGGRTIYTLHFTSGYVKFQLRNFDLMQSVEKGFVLNIIGTCQGFQDGYVIVDDCWVQSVSGELSSNLAPYVGY